MNQKIETSGRGRRSRRRPSLPLRILCIAGALASWIAFLCFLPRQTLAESSGSRVLPAFPRQLADAATPAASPTTSSSPAASPDDAASADPSPSPAKVKKTYVGRKTCLECHDALQDTFHRTMHAKVPGNAPNAANQCEACHGPGSVHVDSTDPADIINPRRLKPAQANAICLRCHEKMAGQYEFRFSAHGSANVECISCHEVHPFRKKDLHPHLLRRSNEKNLCYTCHADVKGQTMMPSHHPIAENRLKCTDCHHPHGAGLSAWQNAPNTRELCLQCHQQFRGPFAVEHPPVADSCLNCHVPHGSMNDDLLVQSEPFLCQRCHITVHNPHVSPTLTPQQQLASQALFFSRCTVCHFDIHGSAQSQTFTR